MAIGLVAGLIVLADFADRLDLLGSPTPSATSTVARAPTPTPAAGAKVYTSLADLAKSGAGRRGDLVEARLDEASLSRDVGEYLKANSQGVTVSNSRVRLRPNQVILTGSARQGVLATDFTLTSHPEVRAGQLVLVIDSLEPGVVSRFSTVGPGETIDLAPNLEARSASVVEGLMVVVGVLR
jgi:hypothetical protein